MKGFTLLETLIAVSVLAITLVVSLTLLSRSVNSITLSQNRLIASYLAYEGVDLVRNIRDNNWENSRYPVSVLWTDGWSDCVDCEIDYTVNSLTDLGDPFLKFSSSEFYNYTNGADTMFKRRISVSTVSNEEKRVSSNVVWSYRGTDYNEEVVSILNNWR